MLEPVANLLWRKYKNIKNNKNNIKDERGKAYDERNYIDINETEGILKTFLEFYAKSDSEAKEKLYKYMSVRS